MKTPLLKKINRTVVRILNNIKNDMYDVIRKRLIVFGVDIVYEKI